MYTNTYSVDIYILQQITQVDSVVIGVFVFQGNKRLAVEESSDPASSSSSHPTGKQSEGRSLPLKAHYGIHAWKRWALSSSDQSDDTKGKDGSKQGNLLPWLIVIFENMQGVLAESNPCLFPAPAARTKSNLLSLSSEELNVALSRFVREVCRPSGERYSPDSILYLCLGIQQVGTKLVNKTPAPLQ